jgi:hypothetical protein
MTMAQIEISIEVPDGLNESDVETLRHNLRAFAQKIIGGGYPLKQHTGSIEIVAKARHSLPCSLDVFTINGMRADVSDFGSTEDIDSEHAEEYCCSNRVFVQKNPRVEVLNRYGITIDDYDEIVTTLRNVLHVGSCGWCI